MSPTPVTNREFTRSLGAVLGRPAVLPMPAFALRFALGEMADALLLGGERVLPEQPLALGFRLACIRQSLAPSPRPCVDVPGSSPEEA